jgi:hypothetical protein
MIAGGFLLAAPAPRLTGLSFAGNLAAGAGLIILGILLTFAFVKKAERERERTSP